MRSVKRLVLALVLGLLVCDTSGVMALVSPESCTSLNDTIPDGQCPPFCVRCACGVPSTIRPNVALTCGPVTISEPTIVPQSSSPDAPPHEILHVPK